MIVRPEAAEGVRLGRIPRETVNTVCMQMLAGVLDLHKPFRSRSLCVPVSGSRSGFQHQV
jgi:hypothetical protein